MELTTNRIRQYVLPLFFLPHVVTGPGHDDYFFSPNHAHKFSGHAGLLMPISGYKFGPASLLGASIYGITIEYQHVNGLEPLDRFGYEVPTQPTKRLEWVFTFICRGCEPRYMTRM